MDRHWQLTMEITSITLTLSRGHYDAQSLLNRISDAKIELQKIQEEQEEERRKKRSSGVIAILKHIFFGGSRVIPVVDV